VVQQSRGRQGHEGDIIRTGRRSDSPIAAAPHRPDRWTLREKANVDASIVTTEIERALNVQLRFAGEDSAVAEAAEAILIGLEPAIERAVMRLAEQAAGEAEAQLPGRSVGVELREGVPVLVVRDADTSVAIDTDDLEARITLRLSEKLKAVLEDAADESGDSMNAFVVKALASKARESGAGRRYTGTIET
jgi:hypothetical protein